MHSNPIEKVLIQEDVFQLSEADRVAYYSHVCESLGLNPRTQPFAYIKPNAAVFDITVTKEQVMPKLEALVEVTQVALPQAVATPSYTAALDMAKTIFNSSIWNSSSCGCKGGDNASSYSGSWC